MRKMFLVFVILILFFSPVPSPSRSSAEEIFFVKIANVREWVMEQHLEHGKHLFDEREDTFPGIGKALDGGVTDGMVWWGDKDRIAKSSLAEKRVALLDEKMAQLYPAQGMVKADGCKAPTKESGWNVCSIDVGGLQGSVEFFFESSGGYRPYEQELSYAGIRNPSGEIERLSIHKKAAVEDRRGVVFIVTQVEFSFHLSRGDARVWLDRMFPMEYGAGLLVVQRDKDYAYDTDKVVVRVHLDRAELERRGYRSIEVVLGWKDRKVKEFPSHIMGDHERGGFEGGTMR